MVLGAGLGILNIGIDEFIDPRLKEVKPKVIPEKIVILEEQEIIEVPMLGNYKNRK